MTRRKIMLGAIIVSAAFGVAGLAGIAGHYAVFKDDDDDDDDEGGRGAIVGGLRFAKVSLQQGLRASESQGLPISAKFEVDRGKFQLAVHTSKDGKLSQVLVDYSTGAVARIDPITQGDDLAAAQSQVAAMATAKTSLSEAVDRALGDAVGFRAIAVVPNLNDGRPVASVLIFKGEDFRVIRQPLD
jgi:hypothetical protein